MLPIGRRLQFLVLSAVLAPLVLVPRAAAQQCSSSAITDAIRVDFPGCATIDFGDRIDVSLDGEALVAKRNGQYWEATSTKKKSIDSRKLNVSGVDEKAKVSCDVDAVPDLAGATCVAVYHVGCDRLWTLKVESKPDKIALPYERRPLTRVVNSCPDDASGGDTAVTPTEISLLGYSEQVVFQVPADGGGTVQISVDRKRLLHHNKRMGADEIAAEAGTPNAIVSDVAIRALRQTQARALVDITFELP